LNIKSHEVHYKETRKTRNVERYPRREDPLVVIPLAWIFAATMFLNGLGHFGIISWVVLHRENNTPGLIIHFVTNGTGVIPILLGVLGLSH